MVQSVPGLNLASALEKMRRGVLSVSNFELVILAVGSNDLEEKDIDYVVTRTREIIRFMQQSHPSIKLAISTIIPRTGMSCEKKRNDINFFIKKICKDLGIPYLTPLKSVLASNLQQSGLYAEDNIHLSDNGIIQLQSYFTGAAAAHLIGTPGQRKPVE
jgi:lysophospholipase L1-like esterase